MWFAGVDMAAEIDLAQVPCGSAAIASCTPARLARACRAKEEITRKLFRTALERLDLVGDEASLQGASNDRRGNNGKNQTASVA